MLRVQWGKGLVKSASSIAYKQIYRPTEVFNYPMGYVKKYKLIDEKQYNFQLETGNRILDLSKAKVFGLLHYNVESSPVQTADIQLVIRQNTMVRYLYIRFFKEYLFIRA